MAVEVQANEERLRELRDERSAIEADAIDEASAGVALAEFEPVWEMLTPADRARVVALLIEKVEYDGAEGRVAITFRPHGIKTLADEPALTTGEER